MTLHMEFGDRVTEHRFPSEAAILKYIEENDRIASDPKIKAGYIQSFCDSWSMLDAAGKRARAIQSLTPMKNTRFEREELEEAFTRTEATTRRVMREMQPRAAGAGWWQK